MNDAVKGSLRQARVAETEQRILTAARRLFLRKGYQATTLAEIADTAGVGHRTVYLRFGTKAALLKRVTDVAVAGDTRPIDVAHRDWFQTSLTAPTLDDRIEVLARGIAGLMERAGGLFSVVQEAAPVEPLIADAAQAGREDSRDNLRAFVRQAVSDGLVQIDDVTWLQETAALLCHADTFVLLRRTAGWGVGEYQSWLGSTLRRLFDSA